jgi:8-oxo-dGTP diphosphatase
MAHANFNVSLKVILVNDKKQILGLKASYKASFAGFYDLPGGRIDIGELHQDFTKTLKRELKEEIGNIKLQLEDKPITALKYIVPGKFVKNKKDLSMVYIFFVAKYISGKIKLSNEHEGLEWLNVNKANASKYFYKNFLGGVEQYLDLKK